MTCKKCGTSLEPNDRFCYACGAPVEPQAPTPVIPSIPSPPLHRLQLLPPFQHQLQRKQMLLLLLSQQQPQQFRQFPKTHYRQPLHSRRLL